MATVSRITYTYCPGGVPTADKYVYFFQAGKEADGASYRLQATDHANGVYSADAQHANLAGSHRIDIGIWDDEPDTATLDAYPPPDYLANLAVPKNDSMLDWDAHIADTDNPHTVTATQVLGASLAAFVNTSAGAGDAGKSAKLDAAGKWDTSMIPDVTPASHHEDHEVGGDDEVVNIAASSVQLTDAGAYWEAEETETAWAELGALIRATPDVPTGLDVTQEVRVGFYAKLTMTWNEVSGAYYDVSVRNKTTDTVVYEGNWLTRLTTTCWVYADATYSAKIRSRSIGEASEWSAEVDEVVSTIGDAVNVATLKEKVDACIDSHNALIVSKVNDAVVLGAGLCGERITGTTSGTPDTETSHAHGLGRVPTIVSIVPTETTADQVYESTAPDATYIYVKCHIASIDFAAYVY